MKKLIVFFLALALFACQEQFQDEPFILKNAKIGNSEYAKDRIIVKYVGDNRSTVVKVTNVEAALSAMVNDANVEYAEPDYIVSLDNEMMSPPDKIWNPNKGKGKNKNDTITPPPPPIGPPQISNDPFFLQGDLWGTYSDTINYKGLNCGSRAANAWGNGNVGGNDIVIGVIDEGVMWSHAELKDNIWVNSGEVPDNGIDDDSNGFIDDIRGWDFMHKDNSTFDGVTDDHGTHVSGTIGAKGGNGYGLAGMVWNCKIVNGKFLEGSGLYSDAIAAFGYMIDLKKRGVNIVAINCSWGGTGYSQGLYDIIKEAGNNGILVVCSAGNNSWSIDTWTVYPAAYDCENIITVMAMDKYGQKCSFSNWGSKNCDLGAPGEEIISTVPLTSNMGNVIGGFAMYRGTSMASPHVTGAVALYKTRYPQATVAEVKQAILSNVVLRTSFNYCVSRGVLNVTNF